MEIELKLKSSDVQELIDILNALKPVSNVKTKIIDKLQKKENVPKAEEPLPDYTLEAVQKAFGDLAKAGMKADLKELLSRHSVKKVSELPPDEYGKVMDELEELLKGVD